MMRLIRWERYVPEIDDNRERYRRGEPALVVEIQPPSAGVWRRFVVALYEDPERRRRFGTPDGELAVYLATYDDALTEILWRECVGAVEWPAGLVDGLDPVPTDGASLWALRTRLDAFVLYKDLIGAILSRTELEAGLAAPLALPSRRPPFPAPASSPDGIAANVATPA
jgi:hypothetical protein